MEQKKQAMERATVGSGATVSQTADNQLKLNVPSDLSFDTGRADIKPNMRPILDQFASGLSASRTPRCASSAIPTAMVRMTLNNRSRWSARRRRRTTSSRVGAHNQSRSPAAASTSRWRTTPATRAVPATAAVEIFLGERNVTASAEQAAPMRRPRAPFSLLVALREQVKCSTLGRLREIRPHDGAPLGEQRAVRGT
jgi:hypothetical protein